MEGIGKLLVKVKLELTWLELTEFGICLKEKNCEYERMSNSCVVSDLHEGNVIASRK